MATNFGISELRMKFDGWGFGRKKEPVGASAKTSDLNHRLDDARDVSHLSMLIENLVIPKLIADREDAGIRLSEQGFAEIVGTDRKRPITSDDVEAFTALTLSSEADTLLDFVDNCLATGSSVEAIYIELLAPSARRLGEFWENDSGDFVEVTMALWRIQQIVRELALRVPPPVRACHGQRSALFSTMPGEQHSLGTLMIAECFQRAGWDTEVLIEPSRSELTGRAANRRYDLVGLTLTNDCPSGTIIGLIKSIRSASSNPGTCIMIGGRFVNANPHLADEVGADGYASDAAKAVLMADQLVPVTALAPYSVI
ncbi:MAG: B12-binding domain-containing protein [Tsuneonella sp.]